MEEVQQEQGVGEQVVAEQEQEQEQGKVQEDSRVVVVVQQVQQGQEEGEQQVVELELELELEVAQHRQGLRNRRVIIWDLMGIKCIMTQMHISMGIITR